MVTNAKKIVDAARNFACGIYRAYPGDLIDNPFQDIRRFVWDGICGDEPPPGSPPLPQPPSLPFTGGQCNCAKYKVSFEATGGGFGTGIYRGTMDVWGPITSNGMKYGSQNKSVVFYVVCRGNAGTCGAVGTEVKLFEWGLPYSDPYPALGKITGVAPVGTAPNNCGDPPKDYPPAPVTPPGGYKSPPVSITLNDGDTTNIYFTMTPPAKPTPAITFPPVIVNLIRPEINPEINVPISFNFDGTVNIGSPGGGGGGGFGQPDRDKLDGINNTVNNLNNKATNIDIDLKDLINVTNNQPVPPEDLEPPVTNLPPGEHEQKGLKTVYIELTQMPGNAKKQAGGDAPDVVYAGWFEWRQAGRTCPRQPIHFEQSAFVAPVGVDGFAYTLYNGFQGTATSVSYKEKQ